MSLSNITPTPSEPSQSITETTQLEARVAALEARLPANSWFFGNSFIKRVFAVWGHYFVAQLIIGLTLAVLFLACSVVFGGLIAGLSRR